MNKKTELAKNTAIITFGKICTQLVSFLLLPLYTAILSKEEYGIVDLVVTYSALLLPFITLALEQALFRFLIDVRSSKEECKKYISSVVFVSFAILFLISISFAIIGIIVQKSVLLYFSLVLIGTTISAIALQTARGLGDNIGYTLGSTVAAITQIVFNVIFLAIIGLGAPGMMLATFIGNISCGMIICVRCHLLQYISIRFINKESLKILFKYSLPLIPNQLSWWALNASDRAIVQLFIGLAGNGLIAVANKFSGVYIQFSNIFNVSWTESAALHINDKDADKFFAGTINSVFRLFLSLCCGIIVCMPFVFPIMVNLEYKDSYGLIPIFMIASLFNAIVSLYGVIYVAYKKTIEIAKTAIYAASLNIFSHLVLISFIGIYAAAVSTAIGYGSMALYRYFHSRKYITIKFSRTTIAYSIIMIGLSLLSYYLFEKVLQVASLAAITILSIYINRNMLGSLYRIVRVRIGKTKKSEEG